MERAGECPEVVLEAAYGWYWAVDTLAELGASVQLAHPLGVKGLAYRRVKNDVADARRPGRLAAYGPTAGGLDRAAGDRELRESVRHRAKLVGLRTNLKCQVHAVLARPGSRYR
jgi:transposase